jgi:hypothetical protein
MPGDKKVFQSRRVNNRAFAFFGMLICTAILTFFLVREILDVIYVDPQLYYFLEIIIPVLNGIAAGILVVVFDKQVTIEIDDESLTYTKGNIVEKYSLDSFAGTNVINNYMNGGYVNSERLLKFIRSDGIIRQINVPFKEEEFSDIVALIVKHKRANADTEEVTNGIRDSFDGGKRFEIPKDEYTESFTRAGRIKGIIGIIVTVIAVVVCIVAYLKLPQFVFIAVAIIFGFLGPALAAIIYFYGRTETKQALSDTPSFVIFEPFCLTFGDKRYDASEISKIVASPDTYESIRSTTVGFRTVVITDRNDNKHKYCFGRTPKDNKKMVFEGYPELVGQLDSWCFANHIEFRLVLG